MSQICDHGEPVGLGDIHRVFSAPLYELTRFYSSQVAFYLAGVQLFFLGGGRNFRVENHMM